MKSFQANRTEGFTLVEAIVVLGLFCIVSGAVFWLLRQRSSESEHARRRDVFQQEALRYFSQLKQDLRGAVSWKIVQNGFSVNVLQRSMGGGVHVQRVDYERHDLHLNRIASGITKIFSFSQACKPNGKLDLKLIPPVAGKRVFVVTLKGTESSGQEFYSGVENVHSPNLAEDLPTGATQP